MNTPIPILRICANCVALDDGECMNSGARPNPNDSCSEFKSIEQDRKDDEAMAKFRKSLGLPPRNGGEL